MTPEEAESFYEDDEDPQRIFYRFDAVMQIRRALDFIDSRYGASGARRSYGQGGLLP